MMTGLDELFDLYSPSDQRAKVYTRKLAGLRADVLRRAVSNVIDSWDKTSMPPIGLIRRQYHHEMSEIQKAEEAAERRARMLPDHENTPAELLLFALIRALNKHGVLWNFARSCWAGPEDACYAETHHQDYGSKPCQEGRASTLHEARSAWSEYVPGVPEPAAFASAQEGIADLTDALEEA